jgi:hypothetical protein
MTRSHKPTATLPIAADIERVRRRLQKWRRRRKHGARIPEEFWISAVELAGIHRPATVAHALGLDSEGQPAFIELVPQIPAPASECIIEIERPGGGRMKIRLKGVAITDLATLSRALWGAGE